ncbi:MAG: DUF4833 domain-containing protein [Spirochaetes bacterium]|nr:DUF4833 domain-containing protein [Spirochaetota bacterium]
MHQTRQDIFFVRRNTNRNEVRYALQLDSETHAPVGAAPVVVYWQMLEKGPDITEPLTLIEPMAFGVASQRVEGETVTIRLNSLPDRDIRIFRAGSEAKTYRATTRIAGAEAELTDFYAFAEKGFLVPQVKYIEIHGIRDGQQVSEKIDKK